MKDKKSSTLRSRENLLKTLAATSLGSATADEILMAFKEDGTDTLRDLVVKWLETVEDERQHNHLAPSRINIKLLQTQTPKERIAKIVHRVPKVPFILNGVEYDPNDIRRFNGSELHFVVGSKAVPRESLLAFEDKTLLTNWLQMVYLSGLASGTIKDEVYHCTPGYNCYVVFQQPGTSGASPAVATMYEHVNFGGAGLLLAPGYHWPDLSRVGRHYYGLGVSGDWNDTISSLFRSSSLCAYYENADLSGAIRIVVPEVDVFDLDFLGFNDTISSVINFGAP